MRAIATSDGCRTAVNTNAARCSGLDLCIARIIVARKATRAASSVDDLCVALGDGLRRVCHPTPDMCTCDHTADQCLYCCRFHSSVTRIWLNACQQRSHENVRRSLRTSIDTTDSCSVCDMLISMCQKKNPVAAPSNDSTQMLQRHAPKARWPRPLTLARIRMCT
jgi:hypothetical protein